MDRRQFLQSSARIGSGCALGSLLPASLLISGCDTSSSTSISSSEQVPELIVATSYMLSVFCRELLDEQISVQFPVPADVDPAFWEPNAEAVELMQRANLVVINGATYEGWLDTVTLDPNKVFDTTRDFKDLFIEDQEAVTHSHGPEGEHSHSAIASLLWLDPGLALRQAGVLETRLAPFLPQSMRLALTGRSVKLNDRLLKLEKGAISQFEPSRGWAVITSHPIYQYLGARLDWKISSVHWEPGETPSDEEFTKLQAMAGETGAKLMMWEDEPTAETREKLQAMGLTLCVYDPCHQVPGEGDWFSVMETNLTRLVAAIATIQAKA